MAKPVPSCDPIVEERDELMISPFGEGDPSLRTAHFLKPSVSAPSPLGPAVAPELPPFSLPLRSPIPGLNKSVRFRGRSCPPGKWMIWVEKLRATYESVWKRAGIYESIMGSTHKITRHNELVFGVAERWRPETNSFIFPWGEATITLEDMLVLGGYSVLGYCVLCPLETQPQLDKEADLLKAQKMFPGQDSWMEHFMGSGSVIEHEAFLSMWLWRFVFPTYACAPGRRVFPIAVRLSRGTRMALGPAVLAGIYRDLRLLKARIDEISGVRNGEGVFPLILWGPFQLVQLWIWERLPTLQPVPKMLKHGEPRSARWHDVPRLRIDNVRLAIDAAGEHFKWRPYAVALNNWAFYKFYGSKEEWVVIDCRVDVEIQSFAHCLRVSQLVGLDCVEQYLPHRVAMQFGMDQDIPEPVTFSNHKPETAWENYSRSVRGAELYIPHRLFESDVTVRYLQWWRKMVTVKDPIKNIMRRRRSPRTFKRSRLCFKGNKEDPHRFITSGVLPGCHGEEALSIDEDDKLTVTKLSRKETGAANLLPGDAPSFSGLQAKSPVHCSRDDIGPSNLEPSTKQPSFQDYGAGGKLDSSANGHSMQSGILDAKESTTSFKPYPPVDDVAVVNLESHIRPPSCNDDGKKLQAPTVELAYSEDGGANIELESESSQLLASFRTNCKMLDSSISLSSVTDEKVIKLELEPLVEASMCIDDGAVRKIGSCAKPVEFNIQMESAMDEEPETAVHPNGKCSMAGLCANEKQVQELEIRIAKVEEVIASLKCRRYGNVQEK